MNVGAMSGATRFGSKLGIEINSKNPLTEQETDDVLYRAANEAASRYQVRTFLVNSKAAPDVKPYLLLDDDANQHGSIYGGKVREQAQQVRPDLKTWGQFIQKADRKDFLQVEQNMAPVVREMEQTPSHPAQALIADVVSMMGNLIISFRTKQ